MYRFYVSTSSLLEKYSISNPFFFFYYMSLREGNGFDEQSLPLLEYWKV